MVCPLWPLFNRSDSRRVGMVNSIVNNNPANWGYGCVFFLCLLPLYSRIFGFIYEVHTQTTLTTGLRTVCLCHLCFYIANLHFFSFIGQTLYYGANYPRLKQLKDQYDPVDTLNFLTAIQEWSNHTKPLDIWYLLTEYGFFNLIVRTFERTLQYQVRYLWEEFVFT